MAEHKRAIRIGSVTYTIEVSLRRIACTNARGATCPVIQSNTRPRTTVVGMVGPVENVRTAPFLRTLCGGRTAREAW